MKIKIKISLVLLSCCLLSMVSWADKVQEGIELYKCGLTLPAKQVLLSELQKNGHEAAEICYYMGEIYSLIPRSDSALFYYRQGLAIDPAYLQNRVGEGKLMLVEEPYKAEEIFKEVLSGKNKKNVGLILAVARAYAENDPEKATEYLQRAKKIDDQQAGIYVLAGDLLLEKGNNGEACNQYEQAIYFDPSCTEAYVKYARIYARSNVQSGIDMLRRLLDKRSDCMLAHRELGEICYEHSRYQEAAQAYEKCISSVCCSTREQTRYATVLFYYGDYKHSLEVARQVAELEPQNQVVQRLMMYNSYALKAYREGLAQAEKFFQSVSPEDIIGQDYWYYGRLLKATEAYEQAIPWLKKSLQLDSANTQIYREIATSWEKLNCYDSAAVYYSGLIALGGKELTLADYFKLGQCHYLASAEADSSAAGIKHRNEHLRLADSIFGYVAAQKPDSYLGNFWRARVNSALDPETEQGLARPYYQAAAQILEKDTRKKLKLIIECYSYLGYYYYLQKDIPESKTYWNKILNLQPENEVARKAIVADCIKGLRRRYGRNGGGRYRTAFEIAGLAGYPGLCFGEACPSEVFHQTETDRCVQKAAG